MSARFTAETAYFLTQKAKLFAKELFRAEIQNESTNHSVIYAHIAHRISLHEYARPETAEGAEDMQALFKPKNLTESRRTGHLSTGAPFLIYARPARIMPPYPAIARHIPP